MNNTINVNKIGTCPKCGNDAFIKFGRFIHCDHCIQIEIADERGKRVLTKPLDDAKPELVDYLDKLIDKKSRSK